MSSESLVAFVGLAIVLAVTPGPDTFLTLRFALVNRRSGFAAACGSFIGTMWWALAVGLGLAALLEQSAEAYRVVKVAGGIYLLWLGLSAIRATRAAEAHEDSAQATPASDGRLAIFGGTSPRAALRAGTLSTSLNPKVGLFFIAVVPQFLGSDFRGIGPTLILGLISAVIGSLYLAGVTIAADRASAWLARPRVTRGLTRTTAGILAGLGVVTLASAAR